jgi:hypothetical protein
MQTHTAVPIGQPTLQPAAQTQNNHKASANTHQTQIISCAVASS